MPGSELHEAGRGQRGEGDERLKVEADCHSRLQPARRHRQGTGIVAREGMFVACVRPRNTIRAASAKWHASAAHAKLREGSRQTLGRRLSPSRAQVPREQARVLLAPVHTLSVKSALVLRSQIKG